MAKNMEKLLINNDVDDKIKQNVFSTYKDLLNKWGEKKART